MKVDAPFDARPGEQVVRDLRAGGVEAFAGGGPMILNIQEIAGKNVVSIAGISNKTTVLRNEGGAYTIYQSDEYGFQNPKGLWGQDKTVIVAIGDSFVHGACVKSEENLVALIRNVHPKTLNLGLTNTGPLEQFAVIKEYVLELKPEVLLWFYWEGNDLPDMEIYDSHPLLRRYADTDFRQQLMDRQEEIDEAITNKQMRFDLPGVTRVPTTDGSVWDSINQTARLQKIRESFGRFLADCSYQFTEEKSELLGRLLNRSNDYVRSWEGTLYFIYLPSATRYLDLDTCSLRRRSSLTRFQDQIMSMAAAESLTVIDVGRAFDDHPDPLSLFPFRVSGHYNAEGYKLAADTVLDSIRLPE